MILRKQLPFRYAWPLVSLKIDVWRTSAEIPYWWRVTTQIWVVLLIGWRNFDPVRSTAHFWVMTRRQWGVSTRSSDVISRENQWWRNVGCFLRLLLKRNLRLLGNYTFNKFYFHSHFNKWKEIWKPTWYWIKFVRERNKGAIVVRQLLPASEEANTRLI